VPLNTRPGYANHFYHFSLSVSKTMRLPFLFSYTSTKHHYLLINLKLCRDTYKCAYYRQS